MLILWSELALCALLIIIFGLKLSKVAQKIVSAGRFSEGLMGMLVLAAITSFPEVWTSIATVTRLDAPDLGVGDLVGSVIINIMIITALDFKFNKGPLISHVKRYHLLTCGFSIATLGTVIAAFAMNIFFENSPSFFNIGVESFVIILIYMSALFFGLRHTESHATEGESSSGKSSVAKQYAVLLVCAGAIIASGFWLANIGKEIVDIKGWDQMYFGTIVIAITTSLPEIVVSLAAVSIGSPNMALANILGSNLFNILIIPIMDFIYRKGPVLHYVSASHIYSTLLALLLTIVVFYGILYRPKRSFMRLGIGSIISIAIFLTGNYFLYFIINR